METLKVYSPFDNHLIKELPLADEAEVETSIDTAYKLFHNRDKQIPAYERIEILEGVVKIMNERVEELTLRAAEEGGKPYVDSKVEVLRAINGVNLAIEHISQLKGEQIPMGHTKSSANRIAYTLREPIGVVASISAFNHPLNLAVHQTIPAIAVGAPVIIKPASTTPLSALSLSEIFYEAGLPKEWCKVLIAKSKHAEKLATDSRVNFLSFIGSGKIGWYLRSKLSPGTRCALEHGGAAPVIVEPDADLESMIPMLLKGGFYHAGQVCVSVQKVYVHESIARNVAYELAALADKLAVGDPLDKSTEVGPLISSYEVERVEDWVNEAVSNGAEVLCGGLKISDTCYKPTVLFNPSEDVNVSKEEIFGPVVCIYSYSTREEAIRRANSLPFAFQASVFTSNLDSAFEMVNKINATAVMVNDHTAFRVDWMPFGGRDVSGIGMGGIPYSMHEMTREKMFVIKGNVL